MRDSRVSLRDPEECAWRLSRPAHVALTLSIIAAQFLLAIVIPNIEVALGFMGSTLSVFVAFAAPAMIAIGVAKEAGADGSLAWAVLAFRSVGRGVGADGGDVERGVAKAIEINCGCPSFYKMLYNQPGLRFFR